MVYITSVHTSPCHNILVQNLPQRNIPECNIPVHNIRCTWSYSTTASVYVICIVFVAACVFVICIVFVAASVYVICIVFVLSCQWSITAVCLFALFKIGFIHAFCIILKYIFYSFITDVSVIVISKHLPWGLCVVQNGVCISDFLAGFQHDLFFYFVSCCSHCLSYLL